MLLRCVRGLDGCLPARQALVTALLRPGSKLVQCVVRLSTQQGQDSRTKGKHLERSLLSRPTVRIPSAEIDTEAAYILF